MPKFSRPEPFACHQLLDLSLLQNHTDQAVIVAFPYRWLIYSQRCGEFLSLPALLAHNVYSLLPRVLEYGLDRQGSLTPQ